MTAPLNPHDFSLVEPEIVQVAPPALEVDWCLERVALAQQTTTAYLRSAHNLEDEAWSQVRAGLANDSPPAGRLES